MCGDTSELVGEGSQGQCAEASETQKRVCIVPKTVQPMQEATEDVDRFVAPWSRADEVWVQLISQLQLCKRDPQRTLRERAAGTCVAVVGS